MTPTEQALRDAWISEMWAPVDEYHNSFSEPVRKPRPDVAAKPRELTLQCPFCGDSFAKRRLPRHLARAHSATYEEVG
jgi:hypothetical protein